MLDRAPSAKDVQGVRQGKDPHRLLSVHDHRARLMRLSHAIGHGGEGCIHFTQTGLLRGALDGRACTPARIDGERDVQVVGVHDTAEFRPAEQEQMVDVVRPHALDRVGDR